MTQTNNEREAFEKWFEEWRLSTWKPLPNDARKECPKHWAMNAKHHMDIAWNARAKSPISQNEQQEPFGYFKAEPFGWTDCAETEEGAIPLYESPPKQAIPEGWISVKDKHPEQYAAVLVARFDGKYWTISKDAYQFGNNYAYDRDQNNVKVSHWMPLPSAPTNTEVGE